jgi:hypothetical protein
MTFALVATAAQTPTTPVIAATALSTTSIQIALTTPSVEPQLGVAYYLLQRALAGNPFVQVAQVSPGAFPYLDTGLITGDTYLYRAIAVNNSTNRYSSAPSLVVSATTAGASPNGATIPPATQLIDNGLSVWTVVSGVVYVHPAGGSNAPAGISSGVTLLLWYSGVIYQEAAGVFYPWIGTAWGPGQSDPRLSSSFGIKIVGDTFTDLSGNVLQLQGMDISGLEVTSPSMWNAFYNTTQAQWTSIKNAWNINIIRIPLNEGAWNQNISSSGIPYQTIVQTLVTRATATGLYVILDLHTGCPNVLINGGYANLQSGFPDMDNSPAFWTSVATIFKVIPAVMFELFNEPFATDSGTWTSQQLQILKDNSAQATSDLWTLEGSGPSINQNLTFVPAGYQQLLNAARNAGATNVCLVGCPVFSNQFTNSLAVRPTDPLNQLGAVVHYPGSTAGFSAVLAKPSPIMITEFYTLAGIGGYSYAQSNKIGYSMWGANNYGSASNLSFLSTQAPWSFNSASVAWPPF